jgi:hypothetical protein
MPDDGERAGEGAAAGVPTPKEGVTRYSIANPLEWQSALEPEKMV